MSAPTLKPSKIPYVTHAWRLTVGCSHAGPDCENCWAETLTASRLNHMETYRDTVFCGHWTGQVTTLPDQLDAPLRARANAPRVVFVNPQSDLFHDEVPDSFIEAAYSTMYATPDFTYLVLTKRARRMADLVKRMYGTCGQGSNVLPNVLHGVSIGDQSTAEQRLLGLIHTPSVTRFVSYEPAIGGVDFRNVAHGSNLLDCLTCDYKTRHQEVFAGPPAGAGPIDWVICGGESGTNARPMNPNWARSVRDQCKAAGVPFYFKQWGEWVEYDSQIDDGADLRHIPSRWIRPDGSDDMYAKFDGKRCIGLPLNDSVCVHRVGKRAAGDLLDGVEYHELPEILKR